ncbi:MAG: sulfatase family protein [Mariniblastus sp.]
MRKSIFHLCGALLLIHVWLSSTAAQITSSTANTPNIILINLDDADYQMFSPEMLKLYPHIKGLVDQSLSFTNLHVTTPFCAPSRAALFRGQYAHRTGVRVNIPDYPLSLSFRGGYSEFLRQEHEQEELGVWMRRAGYHTMMIGKYHHNGFDFKIPPGWDDFYMSNGGRYMGTYRFTNRDNRNGGHSQNPDDVYRTDQEMIDATRLIKLHTEKQNRQPTADSVSSRRNPELKTKSSATSNGSQPFFLYLAPLAPHRPVGNDFTNMVHKARYDDWHPELRIPRTPDFDTAPLSDKPPHRQTPPYTEAELDLLHLEYLSRARAVKSVDDLLGEILETLKSCGIRESTYIFFTSDNGYQLGQHRLHGKLYPYRICTNVPLYVSGPGITGGTTAGHLLGHIDLCPTILELAGAKLPEFLDGKSFIPLLKNPKAINETTWREPVVIENWQAKRNRGKNFLGAYSGLRYHNKIYVEWINGDKEFYDFSKDPYELNNAFDDLSSPEQQLLKRDLLSSRHVSMNPIVTIIPEPVELDDRADWVQGRAEDDHSIAEILLHLQDPKTKEFWTGSQWSKVPTDLRANVSSNDQQLVTWHFPIDQLYATRLSATAWAVDRDGNESAKVQQEISFKLPSKTK